MAEKIKEETKKILRLYFPENVSSGKKSVLNAQTMSNEVLIYSLLDPLICLQQRRGSMRRGVVKNYNLCVISVSYKSLIMSILRKNYRRKAKLNTKEIKIQIVT